MINIIERTCAVLMKTFVALFTFKYIAHFDNTNASVTNELQVSTVKPKIKYGYAVKYKQLKQVKNKHAKLTS